MLSYVLRRTSDPRPGPSADSGRWIRLAGILLTLAAFLYELNAWVGWKVSRDLIRNFHQAVEQAQHDSSAANTADHHQLRLDSYLR